LKDERNLPSTSLHRSCSGHRKVERWLAQTGCRGCALSTPATWHPPPPTHHPCHQQAAFGQIGTGRQSAQRAKGEAPQARWQLTLFWQRCVTAPMMRHV